MVAIPNTMKAAQVVAHGKPLEFRDVPVPQPGYGQVLVKIEVSGVCHTDVHVMDGDWEAKSPIPIIPGHEGIGSVVKLGEGVSHVKLGDRVGIPWLHKACGHCSHCYSGWETVCGDQLQTGFTANGGFAEYCCAYASFVTKIPDNLSSEQAAPICCAGVTVYKGLKCSDVKPGQTIVIVGAGGGLGHVAVQYGKAMGMKVIGIDAGDSKMKLLKELGSDHQIDFTKVNVVDEVKRLTNGEGAHGSLVLATNPKPFGEAVDYVRSRGTVVCIALPPGDFPLNIFNVVLKAITVKGSIVGTRQDLQEALELAAEGKVKSHVRVLAFSMLNDTISDLRKGKIDGRVVLDMSTIKK